MRSYGRTWTVTLATHITFGPQRLGAFRGTETLLLFVCDLIPYDLLRVHVHVSYLRHVASFNVVVVSFEFPTFAPKSYVGGHNHTYGFLSNHRFCYIVPRLESCRPSFLGSSFQIRGISTVGLQ